MAQPVQPRIHTIRFDAAAAEKGEYQHFMQKEIHEQVRSLTDTLAGRVDFQAGRVRLPELNLTPELAQKIRKIYITACGTAAYAGMVGKILIEKIARLPCELQIASEFRYSDPIVDEHCVVLAISQSGETADTLAAMEEGRRKGATIWSIVNAIGSQAMRVADGSLSMQTGPEIGVASTKAFTAPLVDLYMLAVLLADLRGVINRCGTPGPGGRPAPGARSGQPGAEHRTGDQESCPGPERCAGLPVPGARHQHADRLRRRTEAQGNLLHPCRRLPGR